MGERGGKRGGGRREGGRGASWLLADGCP